MDIRFVALLLGNSEHRKHEHWRFTVNWNLLQKLNFVKVSFWKYSFLALSSMEKNQITAESSWESHPQNQAPGFYKLNKTSQKNKQVYYFF